MRFRKDARRTAAALDKARELSREEPSVDWSETEWKKLMAAAIAQKVDGKAEREKSDRKAIYRKPALAYGGAALIMMAIIGYALRNSFFRPAAAPESYARADARKDVSPASPVLETAPPGSVGGIAKPSEADAPKTLSETTTLDARAKKKEAEEPKVIGGIAKPADAVAAEPAPSVILAGKPAARSGRPQGSVVPVASPTQDAVTIRLVSPETGLQIVWVLNKNFEWKGESR